VWLEFDEDFVVHNKDLAIVSLSVIIEDNLQKPTSPIADDSDTTNFPSDSTTSAPGPPIPTLAEALTQLDDLHRFFQSMSISTLAFPHTVLLLIFLFRT